MKKRIILAFVFLTTNAFAKNETDILIFHPDIEWNRQQAEAKANPETISLAQYLNEYENNEYKNGLKKSFSEAQQAFLSIDHGDIELKWAKVVSFAYKADWRKTEREMIQYAWLRLAQISRDANQVNSYLSYAVQYDSTYQPDTKIFPPPLIEQYNMIKKREGSITIPTSIFTGYSYLLLNGVSQDLTKPYIHTTNGIKRIKILSSQNLPVSEVLNASEIKDFRFNKLPILSGSCNEPEIHESIRKTADSKRFVAIYHGGCRVRGNTAINIKLAQQKINYDLIRSDDLDLKLARKIEQPIFKKSIFWVGAGIITAAVLLAQNRDKKTNENAPTSREGF